MVILRSVPTETDQTAKPPLALCKTISQPDVMSDHELKETTGGEFRVYRASIRLEHVLGLMYPSKGPRLESPPHTH